MTADFNPAGERDAVCEQTNPYWKRIEMDSFEQKKLIHLSRSTICFAKPISVSYFIFHYCESHVCHRRTGRGGRGGSCPPPKDYKVEKSGKCSTYVSRAKSWKLKSQKCQKAPSLLGKQRQSGNIRFTVGQYWLIIKRTGTNYVNFVVKLVMCGKSQCLMF
jgi:hypothetical protein